MALRTVASFTVAAMPALTTTWSFHATPSTLSNGYLPT